MKLNISLLLYIPFITAQSRESSEITPCYTKMECKMSNVFESVKTNPEFKKCASNKDDQELLKCAYKLAGFKDSQAEVLYKLIPAYSNCSESSIASMKPCLSKCPNADKSCKESCSVKRDEISNECFSKQLNVKDFDSKKAAKCSSECTQDTVSELYDCDRKCKEPLYKKFESGNQDSSSESSTNSKSNQNKSSTSSSKESKSTSGSNTASTQHSGGYSNLSAGLLTFLTFSSLLSLVF